MALLDQRAKVIQYQGQDLVLEDFVAHDSFMVPGDDVFPYLHGELLLPGATQSPR